MLLNNTTSVIKHGADSNGLYRDSQFVRLVGDCGPLLFHDDLPNEPSLCSTGNRSVSFSFYSRLIHDLKNTTESFVVGCIDSIVISVPHHYAS